MKSASAEGMRFAHDFLSRAALTWLRRGHWEEQLEATLWTFLLAWLATSAHRPRASESSFCRIQLASEIRGLPFADCRWFQSKDQGARQLQTFSTSFPSWRCPAHQHHCSPDRTAWCSRAATRRFSNPGLMVHGLPVRKRPAVGWPGSLRQGYRPDLPRLAHEAHDHLLNGTSSFGL